MPRWDFSCEHCNTTTERSYGSYAASLDARCETCNQPLTRLPARTGFVLAGGGWYADGYAQKHKSRATQ